MNRNKLTAMYLHIIYLLIFQKRNRLFLFWTNILDQRFPQHLIAQLLNRFEVARIMNKCFQVDLRDIIEHFL